MSLVAIQQLVERAMRPALLGSAGKGMQKECAADLAVYFNLLGKGVVALGLEQLANTATAPVVARDHAELAVGRVVRHLTPVLANALKLNIYAALMLADKLTLLVEDDSVSSIDRIGLSAQEAADYAATRSAQLITDINNTTRKRIADAVSNGILDQLGVGGLGRSIRDIVDDMEVNRSETIATTEMNDAMSEADLRKIQRLGYYKRVILGPNPCEICTDNDDAGAIPADDLFPSGDLRTPFHPNCICAIVGARAPEENA